MGWVIVLGLAKVENGVVLLVKAQPKAKKNAIAGVHDGRLKVSVTEAPEKGKANAAINRILARSLGLRRSEIELVRGATSPHKEFLVRVASVAELRSRVHEIGVVE